MYKYDLPAELWSNILGYVDLKSLQQLHSSCSVFRDVCVDQPEAFWHDTMKAAVPWHKTIKEDGSSDFWLKTAVSFGTQISRYEEGELYVGLFKNDTRVGYTHAGLLNPEITWQTENGAVFRLDMTSMAYETREKPDTNPEIPFVHTYCSALEKDVCVFTYMSHRGVGMVSMLSKDHSVELEFPDPVNLILYRIEYGHHSHELVLLFQKLDDQSDMLFAYFPCFERKEMIFLGALNHVDRTVDVKFAQGRVVLPCKSGITVMEAMHDTEQPSYTYTYVLHHQGRLCFALGKYVLVYGSTLTTPDTLPVDIFDDCCYWLLDVAERRVLKSRDGARFSMNALGGVGPVILEGNNLFLGLLTDSRRHFSANLHSHIQLIQGVITEEQITLWFGEQA